MRRMLLAAALVALAISPVTATLGQDAEPARADKEGWWNRGGLAPTPAGPLQLPESVPEGAIGIAAVNGEPTKVAALGIVLDAERGSVVERFVLTLKEAEGTGAQQNAEAGAIQACPITAFFAGEENGPFENAPEADCEVASATGERAEDGTWTFDLTAIADAWLDPFGTVGANGIRLDPGDGTFQVSLTGIEDATFDVAITPGQEDDDPFDSTPTSIAGGFTGGSSSGGGSIDVSPPPAVDAPDTEVTVPDEEVPDVVEGSDEVPDEVAAPAPSRAGDVSGNQPVGAYLVGLLLLAGLVLTSLHLGAARIATPVRAGRGVSRALASRTTDTGGSSA